MKFILILFSFSFLNPVLAGPIHDAAKDGDLATVQQLVKEGKVGVNKRSFGGRTPLSFASEYGQPLVVEFLLENGAAIDSIGEYRYTPLHYASRYGHTRIASILIKNKANIHAKDTLEFTPLHVASKHGRLEIAIMLVENGADVNARTEKVLFFGGNTPLSLAMDSGHKALIEYLKSRGATE